MEEAQNDPPSVRLVRVVPAGGVVCAVANSVRVEDAMSESNEEWVKKLLPFAELAWTQGGTSIVASPFAICNLVSGSPSEDAAWAKAARMLGRQHTRVPGSDKETKQ